MDEEEKKKQAAALPAGRLQPSAALGAPAPGAAAAIDGIFAPKAQEAAPPQRPTAPQAKPAAGQSDYGSQMGKVADFFGDAATGAIKTLVSAPGYGMNRAEAPQAANAQVPVAQQAIAAKPIAAASTPKPSTVPATQSAAPANQVAARQPGALEPGQPPGKDLGYGIRRIDTQGGTPMYVGEGVRNESQPIATPMPAPMQAGRQPVVMPTLNTGGGVFASMANFTNQAGKALGAVAENRARNQAVRADRDGVRLGMDAARVSEEMQGNAIRRESAGLELQQAKQLAALQQQVMTATDPAEKARASQQLQELTGRSGRQDWGIQVTPATKNVDGTTTPGSVYRFNKSTGQVERVDSEPQAAKPAGTEQKYEVGQTIVRGDGAKARVLAVDESGKPTQFQPL